MIIKKNGNLLYGEIEEAKTFWKRFRGLMGRKELKDGGGMFFENCSSIHCFYMKIPIDVVYLDKGYKVVGVETVQPWKLGHIYKGAKHVLEVNAGSAADIAVGDTLEINR